MIHICAEWKSISGDTIRSKDVTMYTFFINHLDLGVTYFWDCT